MKKLKNLNLNKKTKDTLITLLMVVVLYIICEVLMACGLMKNLIKSLLVPFCTYSILAVSLNLTVGILGELSLGHAGFMCVGAFAGAFFSKIMLVLAPTMPAFVRFFLALLVGTVFAAFFGFLIGIPVLRLKGDYLAIVTLAFGEIIKNIVNVLYIGFDKETGFKFSMTSSLDLGLTGDQIIVSGAQGILGVPRDSNFTIGFVLLVITLIIVLNFINSRDGRAVMAIRDNTIAAESVGVPITKYKLMAFTISAALAGLAGVLYAHNLSTLSATPKNFGYNMSIMILVFVVLGGIGNIRGSVISAILLTLIPELLRGLSNYRMLIYAVVLIVMMLFNWAPSFLLFREKIKKKFIDRVALKKAKKNTSKEGK